MDLKNQFSADFQTLNGDGSKDGPTPLKWQFRMFAELCRNEVPKVCDLPTGMGKTSIIHLWMLALRHQIAEKKPCLPTRLVYVVDRRTVVDQATSIAERIKRNLPKLGPAEEWLSVSTLRGQFADNRDWTTDPSRPAIIIGTVDMIGSRLLFSGYRSSYKQRPLHAGMLGQDTLLVLDEAHLSAPFEKLIRALSDQGDFQHGHGKPMRVMCMSATTSGAPADDDGAERFKLVSTDLEGDRETNPIIRRYDAKKRLFLEPPVDKDKFLESIIKTAIGLAEGKARVVVFVQRPDEAGKIAGAIRKKLGESHVEVLTGTMRGLERDELLKKPVMLRFLDGEEQPEERSSKDHAVLVSTSAGEVGFDLNADHMVCDAAPLDSIIQRLGRVNRRGDGDAEIRVFVTTVEGTSKKAKSPAKRSAWEAARVAALSCLNQLTPNDVGARDASPRSIDELKKSLTKEQLQGALSPKPETVELTDILLDAWSMTTITGRMPGRSPVAPWLRGLTDDEPQTTIAWRGELDLDGFDQLDISDLEEWFDAHRVLPHETLSVPTRVAQEWIRNRWKQFDPGERTALGERSCIIDRAGLKIMSIGALADELEKRADAIRGSDIVLPASFGGIQHGLLKEKVPSQKQSPDDSQDKLPSSDVADIAPKRERHRFLRTVENGVEEEKPLFGSLPPELSKFARFTLDLSRDEDHLRQLISYVPKWERPEYGTIAQSLKSHVGLVEKFASEIAGRLPLSQTVREALALAAEWHDRGKNRDRWQDAAGGSVGEDALGKSGGSMGRIRGGYRHEFGSLCEFADKYESASTDDVFDLAMHLIAAHHGRGRPHFPKGGFDPCAQAKSPQIALATIRRFARLQRQYGYWQLAWLENLLRCADAMASADKGGQV